MTVESVAVKVHDLIKVQIPKSYVGDFPSLTADGLAIKLSPGEPPTRYFGGATDNLYKPSVTLNARNESYAVAAEWLAVARSILEGYREGSELVILVDSPTEYLGRDESKLHEFSAVYKILVKE